MAGVFGRRNRLLCLALLSALACVLSAMAAPMVLPQDSHAGDCALSIHAFPNSKDWASGALLSLKAVEASLDELGWDGHGPAGALPLDNLRPHCGLVGRVDRMRMDGLRAADRVATAAARAPPAA